MPQKPKYAITLITSIIVITKFISILSCSRAPSRADIVKSYEASINSPDIDSLLALFADDAVVDYPGMGSPLQGKDEIKAKAEYDTTLHSILTLTILKSKNDTVFCRGSEINDWNKQAGLSPYLYSSYLFVIRAGKITHIRAVTADSTITAINDVMTLIIPWAQEKRSEALNRLLSGGEFAFSAENARLMMTLLSEWRGSRGEE